MSIDEQPEPPKQLSGTVSQTVLQKSQLPTTTSSTEPTEQVVRTSLEPSEPPNDPSPKTPTNTETTVKTSTTDSSSGTSIESSTKSSVESSDDLPDYMTRPKYIYEYDNDDIIPVHCDSCSCQTLKEMRQLRDRLAANSNPNTPWRVITSDLPGFEFH